MSATSNKFAKAVLFGCALFVAAVVYVAHKIYSSYLETGIPVWSGNQIVATLDPLLTTLTFTVFSVLLAGLVGWRTCRIIRLNSRGHASEP